IRAIDATGAEAIKSHAITVSSPMTITTTAMADVTAGSTPAVISGNGTSTCFSRNNGVSPFSWSITSGTLPLGAAFINSTGCFDTTTGHAIRATGSYA